MDTKASKLHGVTTLINNVIIFQKTSFELKGLNFQVVQYI